MIPFASGNIILVKGLVCKIGILGHLHVFLQMLGSHGVLRVSQGLCLIPEEKSVDKAHKDIISRHLQTSIDTH